MKMDTAAIFSAGKHRKEITMSLMDTIKPQSAEHYGATPAKERNPISVDVSQLANRISVYAQQVSEMANVKLQPVMTSEAPRACNGSSKESVEYPPLFSDLRSSLTGIESALSSIEYMLSRTEL